MNRISRTIRYLLKCGSLVALSGGVAGSLLVCFMDFLTSLAPRGYPDYVGLFILHSCPWNILIGGLLGAILGFVDGVFAAISDTIFRRKRGLRAGWDLIGFSTGVAVCCALNYGCDYIFSSSVTDNPLVFIMPDVPMLCFFGLVGIIVCDIPFYLLFVRESQPRPLKITKRSKEISLSARPTVIRGFNYLSSSCPTCNLPVIRPGVNCPTCAQEALKAIDSSEAG